MAGVLWGWGWQVDAFLSFGHHVLPTQPGLCESDLDLTSPPPLLTVKV